MRPYDTNSPRTYTHDCDRCRFLGWTIGGGRLTDLYVHESGLGTPVTLIARYGNLGFDYYSCPAGYARAVGHAELWVAQELLNKEKTDSKAPGNSGRSTSSEGCHPMKATEQMKDAGT